MSNFETNVSKFEGRILLIEFAQDFIHLKSNSELLIQLTDVRCNNYAYQSIQTAFNGKGEPSVSFMETFNARWLPDLLAMYDIPIEEIQPIFTDTLTLLYLKLA